MEHHQGQRLEEEQIMVIEESSPCFSRVTGTTGIEAFFAFLLLRISGFHDDSSAKTYEVNKRAVIVSRTGG
jgi:hypothetical protein